MSSTCAAATGQRRRRSCAGLIAAVVLLALPGGARADTLGLLTPSLDFGRVVDGSGTVTRFVYFHNGTASPVDLDSVGVTPAVGFGASLSGTCNSSGAVGQTCSVTVPFTPATFGSKTATLNVVFCSPGPAPCAVGNQVTFAVPLSGVSVPAETVSLSPPSLTFASQALGTVSPPQTVTVTNGTEPMTLGSLAPTGTDYLTGADTCSGANLTPAATCTFQVRFAPTQSGASGANLTATGTTIGNSYPSLSLSGTGGSLPTGPTGLTGATGPTGPVGPPGRVELVVCTKVVVKPAKRKHHRGHARKMKRVCKVKLVSRPVTFRTALRWSG
jgi:hypothetical protein